MNKAEARRFVMSIAATEVRGSLIGADSLSSRLQGQDLERALEAAEELVAELVRRSGHGHSFAGADPGLFSEHVDRAPAEDL